MKQKCAKNFVNLGFASTGLRAVGSDHLNKSFLLLFFKKDASLLRCNLLISLVIIRDRLSYFFHRQSQPLSHTDTHGNERAFAAAPFQPMHGGHHQAGA